VEVLCNFLFTHDSSFNVFVLENADFRAFANYSKQAIAFVAKPFLRQTELKQEAPENSFPYVMVLSEKSYPQLKGKPWYSPSWIIRERPIYTGKNYLSFKMQFIKKFPKVKTFATGQIMIVFDEAKPGDIWKRLSIESCM
jgi:hypothetical protein